MVPGRGTPVGARLLEPAGLGLVALAAALWAGSPGPRLPDEVDYWQLGEAMATGQGFRTRMVRPFELAIHPRSLFQDALRPPLFPALVALQRLSLGDRWFSSPPVNVLAFAAFTLAQWGVARALGGPWAGRAAWALAVSNPHLILYATLLLSEPWFLVATTLLLGAVARFPDARMGALAGFFVCTSSLLRAVGLLGAGVLAGALLLARCPLTHVALACLAFASPLLPWLVTRAMTSGPFGNLNLAQLPTFTAAWPGYSLCRTILGPRPWDFLRSHPGELLVKWREGFSLGVSTLLGTAGPAVVAFLGAFALLKGGSARKACLSSGIAVAIHLLSLPLYEPRARQYLPLVAWVLPVAAVTIAQVWERGVVGRGAVALFWVAWAASCLHDRGVLEDMKPLRLAPDAASCLESLPPGTIVVSDAPWLVVMASPHRSIWIPQDEATWEAVDSLPGVCAVYLTPGFLSWSRDQRPALWEAVLRGEALLPGYRSLPPFSDGSRLWVREETGERRTPPLGCWAPIGCPGSPRP